MTKKQMVDRIQAIEQNTQFTAEEKERQIAAVKSEYEKPVVIAQRHMRLRYPGPAARS